jgi:transposase
MTLKKHWLSSMRFRPFRVHVDGHDVRPDCVIGDRGYDAAAIRHGLRNRGILALVAMRRTAHGSALGRWQWVVERTFALLNQFRRLRVSYDERADISRGLSLAGVHVDLLACPEKTLEAS